MGVSFNPCPSDEQVGDVDGSKEHQASSYPQCLEVTKVDDSCCAWEVNRPAIMRLDNPCCIAEGAMRGGSMSSRAIIIIAIADHLVLVLSCA